MSVSSQSSALTAAETTTTAPGSVRRFVALIVAGTAILQLLWIAVVPPFRGTDEFDHAYRAAGVASGQWRATETADDGRGLLVEVPATLVDAAHDQCAALDYTGPDNCRAAAHLGDGKVLVASGAGAYHPAFYWVVGTVAKPFSGATALYAMRVSAALLCLLFIGMAAWAVAVRSRSRWSKVGLVVAMTPVMLYSTALPAPNGLEMAAALAFWCCLLSLDGSVADRRRERMLVVGAVVSTSVLMIDRTLGPLFALLILLSALCWNPALIRRVWMSHRRPILLGSGIVLAFAAWGITWFISTGAGAPAPEKQGGNWVWSSLILWPMQAIAAFPFRNQPGPMIVYPIALLIFSALVLIAMRVGTNRERVTLLMTLVVGFALPVVLTALTYEGRGAMWQGRYGLPFTMGIVLVATSVLDAQGWATRFRPGVLAIGGCLMTVVTASCLVKIVDDEQRHAASSMDPSWHAPGTALLVIGSAFAWALLYRAVAVRQRDVT